MSYDHWKTTNPADEWLGPEDDEEDDCEQEWFDDWYGDWLSDMYGDGYTASLDSEDPHLSSCIDVLAKVAAITDYSLPRSAVATLVMEARAAVAKAGAR